MTTAKYVALVLDLYDGAGNKIVRGSASLAPSGVLPDPADHMLVGQAPILAAFGAAGPPQVLLISTDSIGPQPDGWTWTITFSGVPGSPPPFSFYLRFGDGATQYLSALAQVPAAQPGQQYLPLPSGTPLAGEVPVATGAGEASAWGWPGPVLADASGGIWELTPAGSVAQLLPVLQDQLNGVITDQAGGWLI